MVNATTWRISIDVIVSTKTAYAILDVLRQEDEERLKEKR
jgi:hypothetical protein